MQKKKMKDTATVSAPSRITRREVVCVSREGVERVNLSRSRCGDDLQIQRQPACKKSLLIRESLRHEARRLGNTKVLTYPLNPDIFPIAAAKSPPNAPAKVVEEKKKVYLFCASCLRYHIPIR